MKIKLLSKPIQDGLQTEESLFDSNTHEAIYVIRTLKALTASQRNGYILVIPKEDGMVYSEKYDINFSKGTYEVYDEKLELIALFLKFIKTIVDREDADEMFRLVIKEVEASLNEGDYDVNIFDIDKNMIDALLNFVHLLDTPIERRKRDSNLMLSEAIKVAKKVLIKADVDLSIH